MIMTHRSFHTLIPATHYPTRSQSHGFSIRLLHHSVALAPDAQPVAGNEGMATETSSAQESSLAILGVAAASVQSPFLDFVGQQMLLVDSAAAECGDAHGWEKLAFLQHSRSTRLDWKQRSVREPRSQCGDYARPLVPAAPLDIVEPARAEARLTDAMQDCR